MRLGLTGEEASVYVLGAVGLGITPERLRDEQPAHEVQVHAFRMARTPLTNESFTRFMREGGYQGLAHFAELVDDYGVRAGELLAAFIDHTGRPGPSVWADGAYPEGTQQHPVSGISFYEAAAVARFYGAQLPTEQQWEYAARYPDGRHFPWGNTIASREVANFKWAEVGTTSEVGAFADGASALGLVDLSGNVHEWTQSRYRAYPGGVVRYRFAGTDMARVARGGAFNGDIWDLRTTSRFGVEPLLRFPGLGVRLASK